MTKRGSFVGPLTACLMLCSCVSGTGGAMPDSSPMVAVSQGTLRGSAEGELQVYRGVPYAEAPVGALRWAPPRTAKPWDGVRDARAYGHACIQPPVPASSLYNDPPRSTSEDCLNLNIWAPQDARDAPVIVWIHGGSLRIGASSLPMYDGAHYAERGVVFVSINYRLGPLGWMAHDELSSESPAGISGNYGLLDQIAARKWVSGNIANFGGDPANVTIMGESAGALSATYLLASPKARGLFAKAIIQSTNLRSFPELKAAANGMPSAEQIGARLLETLGAGNIEKARQMDAQDLTDRATIAGFVPQGTIDNEILPDQLIDIFDRGEHARVPVIVGYNAHEYRPAGGPGLQMPASEARYDAMITRTYGDLAPEFLRLYSYDQGDDALLDAVGDIVFGWSGERIARTQHDLGVPSYFYVFDHCYPSARARDLCAFHASELPFTFGNLHAEAMPDRWPVPDGARDRAVSDALLDYWTSFAATGRPHAADLPNWLPYGSQQHFLRVDGSPIMGRNYKAGMFELHETFVRRRREAGKAWGLPLGLDAAAPSEDED